MLELRNKLIKYLDKEIAFMVRQEGETKGCYFAGKDRLACAGEIQCNHIIPRGVMRLRFDYYNLVPGCAKHNFYYQGKSNLLLELIKKYDPIRYEYLTLKLKETNKVTLNELMEIKEFIKKNKYQFNYVL